MEIKLGLRGSSDAVNHILIKLDDLTLMTTENLFLAGEESRNKTGKNIVELLEDHEIAFDIGSYRSAPPGLRIWGGPTVENDDVKNLLPWLDWAYYETLDQLKI